MTSTENESALQDVLIELSESRTHAERQHLAMNLLVNEAVDYFAEFVTTNGCRHRFGIGIASGVPLRRGQLGDLRSLFAGARSKEVVVVLWRAEWPALHIRQISVFSPESFSMEAEALRTASEHRHAGEPDAIGVDELRQLMERVIPLLQGAERDYRATRMRRGNKSTISRSSFSM